jgi:hypothetical protein
MWLGRFSRARFGRRLYSVTFVSLAGAFLALACSGRSETIIVPPETGAGGTDSSGSGGVGASGRGGTGAQGGRGGGAGAAGSDAGDVPYDAPACPDEPAPPGFVECDIFAASSGCPSGTGCYPDLEHPFGDGCDQQTLNIVCRVAGSGVEGDLCGAGTGGCAPGFTCIVGAEAGKRCLRICDPTGRVGCPAGAICGETDARGIGVCA